MIDNFIFFFFFEEKSRCAKANNLNDAMMVAYSVTHTHRLMLMIYALETRREKEAKWKRGHHEQIHSFYWLKWFDRHFEILFCRIIAYLCAVVFNVQCQLPNGQESSTFIEEKKAKQAICHKLKFNNNNRYTISRAHSFIYTTAAAVSAATVAEAATAQNLTQRRFKAKSIKKSASITISID